MTKTLRQWLPADVNPVDYPRLKKLLDLNVDQEFSATSETDLNPFYRWPGSHKYVWAWCVLENGTAVAWNENPGKGWSFPVLSGKVTKTDVVEVHVVLSKGTSTERKVYMDKHGLGMVNHKQFAGQFVRSTGEYIIANCLPTAGAEGSLVTVPGITRWTIPSEYLDRVIAEYKVPGVYVEKAT